MKGPKCRKGCATAADSRGLETDEANSPAGLAFCAKLLYHGMSVVLVAIILCIMNIGSIGLSMSGSIVTPVQLFGRRMFIKRDDLARTCVGDLCGNKARKLLGFIPKIAKGVNVLSYGGYQSNSMAALARLVAEKDAKLHYFTQRVPSNMWLHPVGNFKTAVDRGSKIIDVTQSKAFQDIIDWSEAGAIEERVPDIVKRYRESISDPGALWIRQGGCDPLASVGIEHLASEIASYIEASTPAKPWKVVVASGTGTTAYYLARHLARICAASASKKGDMPPVEVLAVPCVSSAEHLQAQIDQLHMMDGGGAMGPSARPTVLSTQRAPRRMFAKPYAAHWQIWQALKAESGIEFDLIYAPRAFEVLLSQCDAFDTSTATDSGSVTSNKTTSLERWMEGCNIMYYHCGGVEGNESQLQRYRKIHT